MSQVLTTIITVPFKKAGYCHGSANTQRFGQSLWIALGLTITERSIWSVCVCVCCLNKQKSLSVIMKATECNSAQTELRR